MRFRIRKTGDNCNTWIVADGDTCDTAKNYIDENGIVGQYRPYNTQREAQEALDMYLKNTGARVGEIRTFSSGATRDTDRGKLDYIKALSPIVLRRYVQYLDKHRKQPDGADRDFDNWKNGIPESAYISSNGRHFVDAWLLTEGYSTEDNYGPVELQDALCAQLFNIMGRLYEILKKEELLAPPLIADQLAAEADEKDRTTPVPGGY